MRLNDHGEDADDDEERHHRVRVDVASGRRRTVCPCPSHANTVSVMTAPPMQGADVEGDDRRQRDQRVAERVAHDDRALGEALGPRRADVVLVDAPRACSPASSGCRLASEISISAIVGRSRWVNVSMVWIQKSPSQVRGGRRRWSRSAARGSGIGDVVGPGRMNGPARRAPADEERGQAGGAHGLGAVVAAHEPADGAAGQDCHHAPATICHVPKPAKTGLST